MDLKSEHLPSLCRMKINLQRETFVF